MIPKNILITGGNGQLGHSLNIFFESKNYNIDNLSFNVFFTSLNNLSCPLNLTSLDNVSKLIKDIEPDYIINCAALTNVDFCEEHRKESYEVNVRIVKNIISSMPIKSKLIHISTDYIFDGEKAPYKEGDIPNPINYYGKTKLEAENIIRSSQRKYIIIRTGSLFSEFISMHSNKLCWLLNKFKNEQKIFSATDMISTATSTGSLAHIIFKTISSIPFNENFIINYSGQDSMSVYDFSLLVAKTFNFNKNLIEPILMKDLAFKAKRPKDTSLNTDFINNLLDCNIYETEYSLNIIKDMVN